MSAVVRNITLDDKYARQDGEVYLTGIQALVRIALDRARLDRAAGLKTAGFVSGYRGSPLGGFDQQLMAAKRQLDAHDIVFQPGVNEELAATAVWGSQKVGLAGKGSDYDGVFGLWYGKAPGVDRCGDVFKHANMSGTAPHGGVLALAGDDHLAKSSTIAAQSEFAFMDAEMPVLNPADLQEVLDYGLYGLELSRFCSLWVGFICLADTMDSSGIVSVDRDRLAFKRPRPEFDPRLAGEQNKPILLKTRLDNEHMVREVRLPAAKAFVRANGLDGVRFGSSRPRFGLIAAGKAYRDLRQALALLGIDEERARGMGLAIYKVAMPWPLEPIGISSFARGLERVLVVEHKRPLIETQIKDLLYHWPEHLRPRVWGKTTPDGAPFLSPIRELAAADILPALMAFIPEAAENPDMRRVVDRIVERSMWAAGHASDAKRSPYFCSGCPHNTSTRTPEGARAMPGIGCHAMAEINERTTEGLVAMGGEGVPWVGQAPFARDRHMFVNLGDGTYFHSGSLAIRQAVAAKVSVTYKILFNDAVAMTGGQRHDGPLDPLRIARQLAAEGVEKIALVSERPELYSGAVDLPPGVPVLHRDELMRLQEEFAAYPGVSAIIYDQTCAAEKRRRRKRKEYPDPDLRVFINDRVCEDCGDCSVQSNCVSVEPLETPFGRKRIVNQSSCNKDYSCAKGFCPSFVEVHGAKLKRAAESGLDVAALARALPAVSPRPLPATLNLLVTGIGGMGVTTVAAVLAMAGHLDGLNVSTLDMTGLAQKGGPVTSHVRFAARGQPIEGPRIPAAALDVLLASDMLVAATAESLAQMEPSRTDAVANSRVAPTAEFAIRQTLSFEAAKLTRTLEQASRSFVSADVATIAEKLFGDAILSNMILVGMAWQRGLLPLSYPAVSTAIRLNGAAADANLLAFQAGRVLAATPDKLDALAPKPAPAPSVMPLDERIAFLADELTAYQDAAYAARFRNLVERVREAIGNAALDPLPTHPLSGGADSSVTASPPERGRKKEGVDHPTDRRITALVRAVAESLYRVMAIKDEYEVARLHADPAFRQKLEAQFEAPEKLKVLLAPPLLSRVDPATGRPKKRAFGPWMFKLFPWLAAAKRLRGGVFDVFGYTAERRAERALRERYIADVEAIVAQLSAGETRLELLAEFARWPELARGFGPIKEANMERAEKRRADLLARLEAKPEPAPVMAAAE